eukprot:gene19079-37061_t
MRLLVTGGAGFALSHAVRAWLEADRRQGGRQRPRRRGMMWHDACATPPPALALTRARAFGSATCVVFDRRQAWDHPQLQAFLGGAIRARRVVLFDGDVSLREDWRRLQEWHGDGFTHGLSMARPATDAPGSPPS